MCSRKCDERVLQPNLKHLLDLPARQIDVQLMEKLVDLVDVQEAVSVLICLLKRLLQPRFTQTLIKENLNQNQAETLKPI